MATGPIDFEAVHAAFAQTMQASLGLDTNHVVQLQMESPPASRPSLPFASFQTTGLGTTYGRDSLYETQTQDQWVYAGPRMLTTSFQFYGQTHEQAFGLCAHWHSCLDQDPTQEMLMALAGLSVWRRESPTDISAMLFTGYEGRASLNCTFGVQGQSTVTMSNIEEVPVTGQVNLIDGSVTVTFTDAEG